MNKKVFSLILSGLISVTVVGCNNNETNNTQVQDNKQSIEVTNQDKAKYEECNILSFEVIETNRKDDHLLMKIKITNNGDKPVNNYGLTFGIYDKDGNILESTGTYEEMVLQPGKSCNKELYIENLEAADIQLTDYYYQIHSEGIKVWINVELQTIETSEIDN